MLQPSKERNESVADGCAMAIVPTGASGSLIDDGAPERGGSMTIESLSVLAAVVGPSAPPRPGSWWVDCAGYAATREPWRPVPRAASWRWKASLSAMETRLMAVEKRQARLGGPPVGLREAIIIHRTAWTRPPLTAPMHGSKPRLPACADQHTHRTTNPDRSNVRVQAVVIDIVRPRTSRSNETVREARRYDSRHPSSGQGR